MKLERVINKKAAGVIAAGLVSVVAGFTGGAHHLSNSPRSADESPQLYIQSPIMSTYLGLIGIGLACALAGTACLVDYRSKNSEGYEFG